MVMNKKLSQYAFENTSLKCALDDLTAERDSLKEQLHKAQQELNETKKHLEEVVEKRVGYKLALRKSESDKVEAVRIAIKNLDRTCHNCEEFYGYEGTCPDGCEELKDKQILESLNGQKFEELSR